MPNKRGVAKPTSEASEARGPRTGKVVYSVDSYVPLDKTPRQQYHDLEAQELALRMRMEVLMELGDETHNALVKVVAKMEKLAEKHPEFKDWD